MTQSIIFAESFLNKERAGERTEMTTPKDFRLGIKPDGTPYLMGCFEWHGYDAAGRACGGVEWRELPMWGMK